MSFAIPSSWWTGATYSSLASRRIVPVIPVFRPFDKPRPHGVQMPQNHIARRRHQALVVHRDRAEPRLEEMAGHPEPRVVVPASSDWLEYTSNSVKAVFDSGLHLR